MYRRNMISAFGQLRIIAIALVEEPAGQNAAECLDQDIVLEESRRLHRYWKFLETHVTHLYYPHQRIQVASRQRQTGN
jgi:hypothetical protein